MAATNRDLRAAVESRSFREDLYYRLHVFEIRLPPLRDRREDILPLAEEFLAEIGRAFGRPPAGISRDARERLLEYAWPGNVRELRNALERAAILCEGGLINAEHLSLAGPRAPRSRVRDAPLTVGGQDSRLEHRGRPEGDRARDGGEGAAGAPATTSPTPPRPSVSAGSSSTCACAGSAWSDVSVEGLRHRRQEQPERRREPCARGIPWR